MKQQIVIPWRDPGCIYRKKHFEFLYKYYSEKFDVIVTDHEGEFNVAVARNLGVQQTKNDVAVVLDGDNFIPHSQIFAAVDMAKENSLVKPFKWYGYLTESSTAQFYNLFPNNLKRFYPKYINGKDDSFCGGGWVMKKNLWFDIGGMDENFPGWGSEDTAFHIHCDNIGLPIKKVNGYDYHLFHPAKRVTSEANKERLRKEYINKEKPR
jgi:glycosyltransferase involved in cell wall biosynthesis